MDATELQPSLAASIGASEHSTASSSAAATASVSAAATASVAKAKKARKVIRKGAFQVAVWNFPCVSGGKDGKDSQVSFYLFFVLFIFQVIFKFSIYFQIFNLIFAAWVFGIRVRGQQETHFSIQLKSRKKLR